jgi:hypothetical protein
LTAQCVSARALDSGLYAGGRADSINWRTAGPAAHRSFRPSRHRTAR